MCSHELFIQIGVFHSNCISIYILNVFLLALVFVFNLYFVCNCICICVCNCICICVLTSPWWGCLPSRVYSGRKYRRTELIIWPVLCKYLIQISTNMRKYQYTNICKYLMQISANISYKYPQISFTNICEYISSTIVIIINYLCLSFSLKS